MPRRAFAAFLTAAALLLHASAQENAPSTNPDPVSAQIQAGVKELMGNRQKMLKALPDSQLAAQIADILSKAAAELTAYDAQLRPQNLPREERVDKLRKRFRERMNLLYNLKPTGGFDMSYGESYFVLTIWRTRTGAGGFENPHIYILSDKIAQLFDMMSFFTYALQSEPDTFNRAFKMALKDFMREGQGFAKRYPGSKFESELLKRFSEIKVDLINLDEELRQQNAPHEERMKALRERYTEWMERFNHFGPIYDGDSEYDIKYRSTALSEIAITSVERTSSSTSSSKSSGPVARLLEEALLVFEYRMSGKFMNIAYYLAGLALIGGAFLAFLIWGLRRKRGRAA